MYINIIVFNLGAYKLPHFLLSVELEGIQVFVERYHFFRDSFFQNIKSQKSPIENIDLKVLIIL